jgi:hypothetical protein
MLVTPCLPRSKRWTLLLERPMISASPRTALAYFANLRDNVSASRTYILCCSVFYSLTHDTDLARLVLYFVPC